MDEGPTLPQFPGPIWAKFGEHWDGLCSVCGQPVHYDEEM